MAGKGFAPPEIARYFFRLQNRSLLDNSTLYVGAGMIIIELSKSHRNGRTPQEQADRRAVRAAFEILYLPEVQAKGINQLWLYQQGKTSPWYRMETNNWRPEDEADKAELTWVEPPIYKEPNFQIAWLPVPQVVRE